MSDTIRHRREFELEYYLRGAETDASPDKWPVEPAHTDELRVEVYFDDDSIGTAAELIGRKLQVQLMGSRRALVELGKYLIAFADLETQGQDPHEHFEDVQNERGEPVHLIIGRRDE